MTTVNLAYVDEFATEVTHHYQEGRKLVGCTNLITGATGAAYNFPVLGTSMAVVRGALGADLVPNSGAYSTVRAVASDWQSTEFVESFDQMKVNFSLSDAYSKRMALALGRRADQIILDAIEAATITKGVPTDISGSVANLTLAALIEASGQLNDDGVPEEDRYFVCSSQGLRGLLSDDKLTSSDYSTVQALVSGQVDSFMGFKFIKVAANRSEGGLPLAGTVRTNYAFHKDAIGFVEFGNMELTVNHSGSKGVDVMVGKMSGAAAVVNTNGVVRVLSSEA